MTRKGMRGQTLPVGGSGRLVVLGECAHANKCLTCPMWLTSTEDLPELKSFYERAVRLKQRAIEKDNQFVVEHQDRILAGLSIRISSLERTEELCGAALMHARCPCSNDDCTKRRCRCLYFNSAATFGCAKSVSNLSPVSDRSLLPWSNPSRTQRRTEHDTHHQAVAT